VPGVRTNQAERSFAKLDDAEGGHGPFRGLDAPFALIHTLKDSRLRSQRIISSIGARRTMTGFRGTRPIVFGWFLVLSFGLPSAQSQTRSEPGGNSSEAALLAIAAAEAKRGVYVFYAQTFIDTENERASYRGSVYGAIQDLKLNGCELKIETTIVDNFSGMVGKVPTGKLQDSYQYVATFLLNREIADALTVVQARPAQLGPTTNSVCDDKSSCAFSWLHVQANRKTIKQTTLVNGSLNFEGQVVQFHIPLSSPAVGNQLIEQIRSIAESRCQ
jgi:hypothetical protein